jgi:hypothetical protein
MASSSRFRAFLHPAALTQCPPMGALWLEVHPQGLLSCTQTTAPLPPQSSSTGSLRRWRRYGQLLSSFSSQSGKHSLSRPRSSSSQCLRLAAVSTLLHTVWLAAASHPGCQLRQARLQQHCQMPTPSKQAHLHRS